MMACRVFGALAFGLLGSTAQAARASAASVEQTGVRQATTQAGRQRRVSVRPEGRLRGGADFGSNASTGVVIDAGSSGSRVYVFRWEPSDPAGTIVELASLRIKPGVSKHARLGGAAAAAQSLLPLLEFARAQPGVQPAETQVHFMATAGMRLIEPALQRDVLAAVEQLLIDSPFLAARPGARARVLSGEEEALYDWLSVNAALRLLGGDPERTASVTDLGGASTQLAFATLPEHVPHEVALARFGHAHVLGVSRLGLGMNEALANMLSGPSQAAMGSCLARGARATSAHGVELEGTGDYDGCRTAIRAFIEQYEARRHAGARAPPTMPSNGQWPLYLFDNFPKGAAILLNATDVPTEQALTLAQLEELGRAVCAVPEDAIRFQRPLGTAQERSPCFLGAYMVELLHGLYGFPLSPPPGSQVGVLKFVAELNGFSMNWPLGAMVFEAVYAPAAGVACA
ncbi:hypothetical protein KFE25_006386 [Diacronema lutheri]|uniref:Apyrase n=2 Tax=Diacronema lutheri TaxID=2081491 RepID=A0A8J5XIW5_DIALT|nr:hypothetical protein KFE25_006386 [Diacronema lutheri]